VKLHFEGVANLEIALKGVTISGNKSVDTLWWRLRMDALRVMRMQDEFELVALDYCVTYEVSPPSWQDALCEYTRDSTADVRAGNGVASARAELEKGSTPQDGLVPVGPEEVSGVVVELVGEILGDAADALRRLEAGRHQGEGRLVVSCARLIRVDFSAAGSILNWVSSRQAEGFTVQFREVHRLVGAFFNVIGINEHAKVVLRAN
jgi:anti-anti-sigma regulatory factor